MTENNTPCTLAADQGVSVLYKGRYLFSRYNPHKALEQYLDSITILDNTLILCLSPVLPFCVDLIRQKIYDKKIQGCFILCAEADPKLYEFYLAQKNAHTHTKNNDRDLCPCAETLLSKSGQIVSLLEGKQSGCRYTGAPLPKTGCFRRVLTMEGSAAVRMYKDFYAQTADFAQNSISMFWKNRMTLLNLGRLFSRNALKNTATALLSCPLQRSSVKRPILVAGAGPSLNALIPFIRRHAADIHIIAVDAAFRPLFDNRIRPDALVAVESQAVSQRAFIGARGSGVPLIADICCRSANLRVSGGSLSFFISEYASVPLLDRIKKAVPFVPVFPPLGSVGLAAVETALFLRAENVSVFVCGLDFSYPAGLTHCKESPAQKEILCTSKRFTPAGNPDSAFRSGVFFITGKGGEKLACDPALRSYAELFRARYKNVKNIYDISPSGIDTGLPALTEGEANLLLKAECARIGKKNNKNLVNAEFSNENKQKAYDFYTSEKKRLLRLRSALTGEMPVRAKQLKELMEECSYLYLHFPDGQCGCNLSQSFLNRVRSETDLFLKDIESVQSCLSDLDMFTDEPLKNA